MKAGLPPQQYPGFKDQLRALLSDGQWHTTQEVRDVGGMSSNSTMGRLREEGLQIIKKRDYNSSGGWAYRLVLDGSDPAASVLESPKERLLELLRDGRWHSNREMFDLINVSYQDHLYFLRKEGFRITKKQDSETGDWCYRLEGTCQNSNKTK